MSKSGYAYILTNQNKNVLYTGVTSNLTERIAQHRMLKQGSFTAKYKVTRLVYYAEFPTMLEAIAEEKRIKAGSRSKKVALIEEMNPQWRDLYDDLVPY